jgi:hypothetical protein
MRPGGGFFIQFGLRAGIVGCGDTVQFSLP